MPIPISNENQRLYLNKLKSIIKLLIKTYSLVVIDTINSPYPGYEGYIVKLEDNIIYISDDVGKDAYAIIPITSIIDIYANNVDVEKEDIGKIKEKIHHILDDKKIHEKEKKFHMQESEKIEYEICKILNGLKKENDNTLLLKIYTKSVIYQVYSEVNLNQISMITPDFMFVYYIDNKNQINNEILIILPLKSIDSIIMYNDSETPIITPTEKERSIHYIYEYSKENLILAKQNSDNEDKFYDNGQD